MNFRLTLALLAAAIIVILGLAITGRASPPASTSVPLTPTPIIFNLQPAAVTEFDIKTNDRETDLIKENGQWALAKPQQDPNVDQTRINAIVGQVATLTGSRSISQLPTDLTPYGLNQPQLTVDMSLAGNKTETLLVGNRSIDGNSFYAMRKGGTEVALIPASVPNGLLEMAITPPRATAAPAVPASAAAAGPAQPSP